MDFFHRLIKTKSKRLKLLCFKIWFWFRPGRVWGVINLISWVSWLKGTQLISFVTPQPPQPYILPEDEIRTRFRNAGILKLKFIKTHKICNWTVQGQSDVAIDHIVMDTPHNDSWAINWKFSGIFFTYMYSNNVITCARPFWAGKISNSGNVVSEDCCKEWCGSSTSSEGVQNSLCVTVVHVTSWAHIHKYI
jgi:hypothetical protein